MCPGAGGDGKSRGPLSIFRPGPANVGQISSFDFARLCVRSSKYMGGRTDMAPHDGYFALLACFSFHRIPPRMSMITLQQDLVDIKNVKPCGEQCALRCNQVFSKTLCLSLCGLGSWAFLCEVRLLVTLLDGCCCCCLSCCLMLVACCLLLAAAACCLLLAACCLPLAACCLLLLAACYC